MCIVFRYMWYCVVCVALGGYLEVAEKLAAGGADVHAEDSRHVSPLMAAFRRGHVQLVAWLCSAGAISQFPNDAELERIVSQLQLENDVLKHDTPISSLGAPTGASGGAGASAGGSVGVAGGASVPPKQPPLNGISNTPTAKGTKGKPSESNPTKGFFIHAHLCITIIVIT